MYVWVCDCVCSRGYVFPYRFKYFQITPSGWMLIHQRNCDMWCEYACVDDMGDCNHHTASARMSSVYGFQWKTVEAAASHPASQTSKCGNQTDRQFSSQAKVLEKNTLNMVAILCLVGTFSSFLLFNIFLLFPFPTVHTLIRCGAMYVWQTGASEWKCTQTLSRSRTGCCKMKNKRNKKIYSRT